MGDQLKNFPRLDFGELTGELLFEHELPHGRQGVAQHRDDKSFWHVEELDEYLIASLDESHYWDEFAALEWLRQAHRNVAPIRLLCRDERPVGLGYCIEKRAPQPPDPWMKKAAWFDGKITRAIFANMFQQLADALHALHHAQADVMPNLRPVHGLLYPGVCYVSQTNNVQIAGSGIATLVHLADASMVRQLAEQPSITNYIPPEIKLGRASVGEVSADIFGLAALMLSMASAREMEEYADPYDLLSDELRGFAGILGECLRPAIDRRIGSVEKILRRLDYLGDSSDAELPKNIPFARSHARMTAAGKYVVVDQPDDPKEKSAGKVIVKAAEVEQRTFPVRMVLPSTPTEKTFDNPNLPKLLLIPGGMHQQGARRGDPDERPPRSVFLNAFYLAETAVTNQAFLQFLLAKGNEKQRYYRENKYGMIQAPSFLRKTYSVKTGFENFPVNNLNWEGAVAYCAWLREESGRPWRLPTEAEWEAAARYKTHPGDQYWWGDDYPLPTHARYGRTWSEEKHNVMIPVDAQAESGRAPCGALNLMGNVWEWCFDFYSRQEYLKGAQANPMGPETGEMRTARGGCWMSQPHELRLTNRRAEPAVAEAALGMGLRMVCDLTEAETELTNLTPEGDVQEPENKAQQAPPVDDDEDDPFAP